MVNINHTDASKATTNQASLNNSGIIIDREIKNIKQPGVKGNFAPIQHIQEEEHSSKKVDSTGNTNSKQSKDKQEETKEKSFFDLFIAYLNRQSSTSSDVFDLSLNSNMNVLVLLSNLKKILKEEKVGYTRLNNEWRFFCNYKTSINFEIEFNVNNSTNNIAKGKENYQVSWIKFKFIEGEIDDFKMIARIIFE
eukprot:CAMPEP_0170539050 /NCGR_PEP_ID=MMETSP0209-20121228/103683_1 /TAXON_ID=665100 ORGANISM="Litonotus pictus, Strain P1" /NCGR_SAMPLE_ID=MMETSP0209 /ASSEMBLY_ACC=CAM_ASM_000301 /LENGTH=193 /DNA_ID=CAMNT_0010840873 /DNA_START=1377 /DNA_END=1955 /DNA_ORIENTATION=-